jgi:hypothetical protein
VLRVDGVDGDASLYFEEGTVVHAECPGARGTDAVYLLFRVAKGEFCFQGAVLPPDRTIEMDSTNLVMEAARLLDESRRDDYSSADVTDTTNQDDGFGLGEEFREPHEIKQDIKCLLKRRFGRKSKRLIKAVDRCGNSVEELFELAGRVEKYVRVFLDNHASHSVGAEIRGFISGTSSSSSSC